MNNFIPALILGGMLTAGAQSVNAIPVDLELILATDTSGSVDSTDFALRRSGVEAAFRSSSVIDAIEAGVIGQVVVTLWDFATSPTIAVDWTVISDSASANAFADAVAAAARGGSGISDSQSTLIDQALIALNNNDYEGRSVIDINSEGAQDTNGCSFSNINCPTVQQARDAFLAGGGDAINAIWMNDRDYFGLDAADQINAFEYGSLNVIGGTGSFQVFAETNQDFVTAIQEKIVREITPTRDVPEPATFLLLGLALAGFGYHWRRQAKAGI